MERSDASAGRVHFLSAALARDVRHMVERALGAAILAVLALVWIALLTWSQDPGQTSGIPGIGTALRPLGPLVAGSLVHLFGLATPLGLLGPMHWGYGMLRSGIAGATWDRTAGWVVALLSGTIAASLLPRPQGWLLQDGLGGVLGDAFLEAMAMLCGSSPAILLLLPPALMLMAAGVLQMLYGWHGAVAIASLSFRGIGMPRRRSRRQSARIEPDLPGGLNLERTSSIQPCGMPEALDEDGDGFEPEDPATAARDRAFARRFAPQVRRSSTIGQALGALALRASNAFACDEEPEPRRAQNVRGDPAVASAAPRSDEPTPDGGCAKQLADLLTQLGVPCAVCALDPQPLFAPFEVAPCRGAGSERVLALRNAIAEGLGVPAVRMTPLPLRSLLRLDVPLPPPPSVPLAQLLKSPFFSAHAARLPLTLGTTVAGAPLIADLAVLPHVLVAGRPGSGRVTLLRSIITALTARHTPVTCRYVLVDSPEAGFAQFKTIEHLARPVAGGRDAAFAAFDWIEREVGERQKRLAMIEVHSIDAFNRRVASASRRGETPSRTVQTGFDPETGAARYERLPVPPDLLPRLVVVIAEAADVVAELSRSTAVLARTAGAVGVHLIVGSALPRGSEVIEALTPHLSARAILRVDSVVESRALLREPGAECLWGRGDMLWTPNGGPPVRLQGLAC